MSWNGSDLPPRKSDDISQKNSSTNGTKSKTCVFVLLIAVIALVAVVFLFNYSRVNDQPVAKSHDLVSKPVESDSKVMIKSTKPVVSNEVTIVGDHDPTPLEELMETNEYTLRYPDEKIVSVETNAAGYIQVEAIKKDGGKIIHVVTPPPIFDHPTDELILAVLNTPDGQQMPPLPPGLSGAGADLSFWKSLKDEIVIKPEDSDTVRAYKEIVRSARTEIAARMDAGEHFSDIIAEQHKLCNDNAQIKSDATRELNDLIMNGDVEGARKYFQSINAVFQQMGITPLKLNEQSNNPVIQEVIK